MLKWKHPFQYELDPAEIDKGISWITLKLKNIGPKTLNDLDVQLHSVDPHNLSFYGTGWSGAAQYISELGPLKANELVFRVNATGSADVYITIEGRKNGDYFWWESSWMNLQVKEEKAKIERLLVLSNPYTAIGKTISAEATIKGLRKNGGLKLEFWMETPSGRNEQVGVVDVMNLSVGQETRYKVETTLKEKGFYTIYAYLYDGLMRIDYDTESVYAE